MIEFTKGGQHMVSIVPIVPSYRRPTCILSFHSEDIINNEDRASNTDHEQIYHYQSNPSNGTTILQTDRAYEQSIRWVAISPSSSGPRCNYSYIHQCCTCRSLLHRWYVLNHYVYVPYHY